MGKLSEAWVRFSTWFRGAGRGAQIGIGCGALIVACVVCGGAISALGASSGGSGHATTGTRGTPQHTTTATTRPNPTETPVAQATAKPTATTPTQTGPAVLGASGQAFIAQYGPITSQSNEAQGDLHFHQYPGVAQDFLIVEEGKYYGVTPGEGDAFSILAAPAPGQMWTLATAKQVCTGFMSTDARYVKRVATSGAAGVDGWDDIYQSASLAKIFPASAFQDASLNPAPDGSFDIMYLYASMSDTSHVGSCQIQVGEQQTQG